MKRARFAALFLSGVLVVCCSGSSNPSAGSGPITGTSMGTLTFTRDDAHKVTQLIDPSGGMVTLTDAAGTTWTLSFPEGFDAVSVTLVPLTHVSAGSGPQVTAGVLFEPDGLVPFGMANLLVDLPAGAPAQTLYAFDTDGSNLWLAGQRLVGSTYSVDVPHFSGVGMGPTPSMDAVCAMENTAYKQAVAAAKATTGPVDVSGAPSLTLDCIQDSDDSRSKLVGVWVRKLMEPEYSAIARILTALKDLQLSSCPNAPEGFPDALNPLLKRCNDKISALMKLPQDPATFLAIGSAELKIEKQMEFAGNETLRAAVQGDCAARAAKGRDAVLSKVRDGHDYAALPAMVQFERWVDLLGGDELGLSITTDELLTRVKNAYRFRVDVTMEAQENYPGYVDSGGDEWGENADIKAHGSGTVGWGEYTPTTAAFAHLLMPQQISMTIDSGTDHETKRPNEEPDHLDCDLAGPCTFQMPFSLSLDPCDDKNTFVGVDSFSPDESTKLEKWNCKYIDPNAPDNNYDDNGPTGLTDQDAHNVFRQYEHDQSLPGTYTYTFHASVKNGQATAVQSDFTSIDPSPTSGVGTFSVTVTHTPK